MLLTIDIGNTNINLGVFRGQRLIKRFNIPTKKYAIQNLKKLLDKISVDDSIICSVVPKMLRILNRDLIKLSNKKPRIVGEDVQVPVRNLYRYPKQVGSDRLVNAYAGVMLYGAPLIIIDFGTAITFDAISKRKEYLGGLILPGLGISLDALAEQTALLPKVKLRKPRELIGRDTQNSILSGVVYGFAALTDDLVKRIKGKIGKKARVVATGGNVELIKRYCREIDKIDKDLTLKGLNLIFTP
jgi:type III pantothenate kinase